MIGGGVGGGLDATEHELLGADPKAVAVLQLDRVLDRPPIDLDAVTTAQVVDDGAVALEHDPRVMARNEGILDRHMAIRASPENRGSTREVEFLKQKP